MIHSITKQPIEYDCCPINYSFVPSISQRFSSQDYWEKWFTTYNRIVSQLEIAKQSR